MINLIFALFLILSLYIFFTIDTKQTIRQKKATKKKLATPDPKSNFPWFKSNINQNSCFLNSKISPIKPKKLDFSLNDFHEKDLLFCPKETFLKNSSTQLFISRILGPSPGKKSFKEIEQNKCAKTENNHNKVQMLHFHQKILPLQIRRNSKNFKVVRNEKGENVEIEVLVSNEEKEKYGFGTMRKTNYNEVLNDVLEPQNSNVIFKLTKRKY